MGLLYTSPSREERKRRKAQGLRGKQKYGPRSRFSSQLHRSTNEVGTQFMKTNTAQTTKGPNGEDVPGEDERPLEAPQHPWSPKPQVGGAPATDVTGKLTSQTDKGKQFMMGGQPAATSHDPKEINDLYQEAMNPETDPGVRTAHLSWLKKNGQHLPPRLESIDQAGELLTGSESVEAKPSPKKGKEMSATIGGRTVTAKPGYWKDDKEREKVREGFNQARQKAPLPEPQTVYERYADDIIDEVIDGKRDSSDPAFGNALNIRPSSRSQLEAQLKAMNERNIVESGGLPDQDSPLPADFVLAQRKRDRMQQKADETGEVQSVGKFEGRWGGASGTTISENFHPRKKKVKLRTYGPAERDIPEGVVTEYEKDVYPAFEKIERDIKKQKDAIYKIRTDTYLVDSRHDKELSKTELEAIQEPRRNIEKLKRERSKLVKGMPERSQEVYNWVHGGKVPKWGQELVDEAKGKKTLGDLTKKSGRTLRSIQDTGRLGSKQDRRLTSVRKREELSEAGFRELDMGFEVVKSPRDAVQLYYHAAGASNAMQSDTLTQMSTLAKIASRGGLSEEKALLQAARTIFGDPQAKDAALVAKANENAVKGVLKYAKTPEDYQKIHTALSANPSARETNAFKTLDFVVRSGIGGEEEGGKPIVTTWKRYNFSFGRVNGDGKAPLMQKYKDDEGVLREKVIGHEWDQNPYDHPDTVAENLGLKDLPKNVQDKPEWEGMRRKSLLFEFDRHMNVGKAEGFSEEQLLNMWTGIMGDSTRQTNEDWKAVDPVGYEPEPVEEDGKKLLTPQVAAKYLQQTNGDEDAAKQLAMKDGWVEP